ncbi:MAG: pyridoxamine 5'-phosphate oxidase family protein [Eubacteriales bacterium]|nr:pyridoxamine 5'-phosphate oxidase family protein [Eubacteriales bacterium]
MFRKMKKIRQELSPEETREILKKGKTGVLGVLGEDDYPYTVPVNYVCVGQKIYLHGAKTGHKIDSIRKHEKVSFCVISQDDLVSEELTTYFKSVIVFGKARVLESEEEIFQCIQTLGLKFNPDEGRVKAEIQKSFHALGCIEITIEHMTGKQSIELVQ